MDAGLILIAGPSGSGKTTLVTSLANTYSWIHRPISHTTRPPRPGETHGVDFYFVSREEFNRLADAGEFEAYAVLYSHSYGTLRSEVFVPGKVSLWILDPDTALTVRNRYPDSRTVFLVPPDPDTLITRLMARNTPDRLRGVAQELSRWAEFDYMVINGHIDAAICSLLSIIVSYTHTLPLIRGAFLEAWGMYK